MDYSETNVHVIAKEVHNKMTSNSELNELLLQVRAATNRNWVIMEIPVKVFLFTKRTYRLFVNVGNHTSLNLAFHEIDFYCEGCVNHRAESVSVDVVAAYLHGIITGSKMNPCQK